jgi:hypothetical protein
MAPSKRMLAGVALAAAMAGGAALASSAPARTASPRASVRALLKSRELWATIDVCDPSDQPNTVGIRGSMPGDGQAHDRMYMSFRLQYMNAGRHWVDLAGASSGEVAVGGGSAARQDGSSFVLKRVAGKPASTLRGVVDFQWRHGSTVLQTATRPTTTGHKSLAGADPASFSAATCGIG